MSKERGGTAKTGASNPLSPGGLLRVREGAVLAGVCAGLARTTGYHVALWRLAFLVGLLVLGLGAVAYLVMWLVMRRTTGPAPTVAPLFRRIDWWTAGITTLVVLLGYLYTLAPDLTLEDSGELAVGSFYAGVPHPPGYPLWTVYTWVFTVLLPFSNIAWRVAVGSAVAGALASGLVALIASRGCSMILESIEELKSIERRWENALCMAGGYVAGMLIGFNGFMWSQAVIVEVYPFSLLSFMVVMATLLRWVYAPEQYRYLYWALFMFGISFTNHMTLIVAAMGIEVAIAAANPRLGRDLFAGNSILFLLGLVAKAKGLLHSFDNNGPLFYIYLAVGVGSMAAFVYLAITTNGLLGRQTSFVAVCMALFWMLGAGFYFFMPLSSMTNPPMNWGYARTWEGFLHALTRGQYERTNPTSDIGRFIDQLFMLLNGAVEEFNVVYLLIAVLPFAFFFRLQRREKAWLLGLVSMYACLAVLLIVLLNPSPDRQSRDMNRVFFTASHVMIALWVAYGLAIFGGHLATQYARYRRLALFTATIAAALAVFAVTVVWADESESVLAAMALFDLVPSHDPLVRATAVFTLLLALAGIAVFWLWRHRAPMAVVVGLMVAMPVESILSHWSDNEQRGHLFGYWFGHDMFTPPFGVYPEMSRDAVLFGGTDPGRFAPTYMIFCESFIPARCKPRDPAFDRRDVYIITQNALADQTYLSYIRAHYNRSTQRDEPFVQGMVGGVQDMVMDRTQRDRRLMGQPHVTNGLAAVVGMFHGLARPLDAWATAFGARVEAKRRAEGVYPAKEIHTPSLDDHTQCMAEYFGDAQRRMQLNQLKPGEDVHMGPNGQLQVSGQIAVMSINGLLTKVIFDQNPTNEFYVEESFPLDWMFPHLEPYGVIMKINRQPLKELSAETLDRDHRFWSEYSGRLIGNWITYDTPVQDVCDFVMRVHKRKNYDGFTGDRKFVRDDQAQKSFSKLRSSIGGLYSWRLASSRDPEEQKRLLREADFALKQAFAFCPYSPEAVYRYTSLLVSAQRFDDAVRVTETCLEFDPDNLAIRDWLMKVQAHGQSVGTAAGATRPVGSAPQNEQWQLQLSGLEEELRASPTNGTVAFKIASIYLHLGRTNDALSTFDRLLDQAEVPANAVLSVAAAYAELGQGPRLEKALQKLVKLTPESPEAWYDLASTQAMMGRAQEALTNLKQAVTLSIRRAQNDPGAQDLRARAASNPGFAILRGRAEFKELVRTN